MDDGRTKLLIALGHLAQGRLTWGAPRCDDDRFTLDPDEVYEVPILDDVPDFPRSGAEEGGAL